MTEHDLLRLDLLGPLFFGFVMIEVALWRTGYPRLEKYRDKADELQDAEWSKLSQEVGELFIEIEEVLEEKPHEEREEDIERQRHIQELVHTGFKPEELETIESGLPDVHRPVQLYYQIKSNYREAMKWFGFSAALILAATILLWYTGQQTDAILQDLVTALVLLVLGTAFLGGTRLWDAYKCSSELGELWDDYRFNE